MVLDRFSWRLRCNSSSKIERSPLKQLFFKQVSGYIDALAHKNENPYAPPSQIFENLQQDLAKVRLYPDPIATQFRKTSARVTIPHDHSLKYDGKKLSRFIVNFQRSANEK